MPDKNVPPSAEEIRKKVQAPGRTWIRWAIAAVILGVIAGAVYFFQKPDSAKVSYRSEALERGDIVTQASATGTLEPTRIVSVGAEISGLIQDVLVEENDVVTAGQMLATFDKTTIESRMQLARARLNSSSASIRNAQANHASTQTELKRTQTLVDRGVVARAELDAMATSEVRARAQLDQARSDAEQQRANLDEVQLQMEKAVILSPIDGVILTRSVEPGQTVAASLQAPELFVVAEDLSKMTLKVWIDEADVGVVKAGQAATFTVSAWPGQTFDATVEKINLSPTTTNNVVTYAAMLNVNNSEQLLRPGMTANVSIVTGKREDVLRVPNAALRFRPTVEPANTGSPLVAAPRFRMWGGGGGASTSVGGRGTVYVLRNGQPEMVEIQTGRTDGRFTEVMNGELQAGDIVVTGTKRAEETDAEAKGAPKGETKTSQTNARPKSKDAQ